MEEKVGKYFYMLHPDYDSLQPEEKEKYSKDLQFISDNVEKVENYYSEYTKEGGLAGQVGLEDKDIVHIAIRLSKADNYFSMLHPNYADLSQEEQRKLGKDIKIIDENIDEIDRFYEESKANGSDLTDQEIITKAVKEVEEKANNKETDAIAPEKFDYSQDDQEQDNLEQDNQGQDNLDHDNQQQENSDQDDPEL